MNQKKRLERLIRRKKVINILRKKRIRHNDLVRESEIPETTVERILKELKILDLADQDREDGIVYWAWYEYATVFSSEEQFKRAIDHSRKLLPGLEVILRTQEGKGEKEDTERECVEQHLSSGYPKISTKLNKLRKQETELGELKKGKIKELLDGLQSSEDIEIGPYVYFQGLRPVYDLSSWFINQILLRKPPSVYVVPSYHIEGKDKKKVEEMGRKIEQLIKAIDQNELDDLAKLQDEMLRIHTEVAGDIHRLIWRIDHGQPLKGKCDLCPKIEIRESQSS